MAAARYLGTSPWELAEQPLYWRDRAIFAQEAENRAQNRAQSMKRSA